MTGSRFLGSNHFCKIGKVVLIENERGFVGLYTVMNEYGKVLLFRLVNDTTLFEVEGSLCKLNKQFQLHGFTGPTVFTTDRCCQERAFYEGNRNNSKEPIFHSFAPESSNIEGETQQQEQQELVQQQQPVTTASELYLDLPKDPQHFSSMYIQTSAVNAIIEKYSRKKWDAVLLDTEWTRGSKDGSDVIQINTMDHKTYIFEHPYAPTMKLLLKTDRIKKIASCISVDRTKLKEIRINLLGEINLQMMAKERGICETAQCSLAEIVERLFSVKLEKDNKVRLSNWQEQNKTMVQYRYAALDANTQMVCYQKMMAINYVKAPAQ